jgi:hypothetical protein
VLRFTRLWDGKRPSACSHGPSGRDVARCIDVGVATVTTVDAAEDRLALAVLTRHQTRNGSSEPYFASRSSRGVSTFSVQSQQARLLARRQAGWAGSFAGRQRRGHFDAPVYADDLSIGWARNRGRSYSEPDVPPSGAVSRNPVRLGVREATRPAKTVPADFGHERLAAEPVQPHDVLRFQRDYSKAFVAIASSPGGMALRPGEVGALGLGKVTQGLLLHHLRAAGQPIAGCTCGRELARLFEIARRGCSTGSPVIVLIHREVPDKPGVGAAHLKSQVLRPSRVQAKAHGEELDGDHRQNGVMTNHTGSRTGQRGTMNESERIGRIRPGGVG